MGAVPGASPGREGENKVKKAQLNWDPSGARDPSNFFEKIRGVWKLYYKNAYILKCMASYSKVSTTGILGVLSKKSEGGRGV